MNERDRLLKIAELAVQHRTERWTADAWIALNSAVRTNPQWCVTPAAVLVKAGLTTDGRIGDLAMREVLTTHDCEDCGVIDAAVYRRAKKALGKR